MLRLLGVTHVATNRATNKGATKPNKIILSKNHHPVGSLGVLLCTHSFPPTIVSAQPRIQCKVKDQQAPWSSEQMTRRAGVQRRQAQALKSETVLRCLNVNSQCVGPTVAIGNGDVKFMLD